MAPTAHDDLGLVCDRIRHMTLDLLDRGLVNQRPLHHAGLAADADLHLGHSICELLDEGVMIASCTKSRLVQTLARVAEFGRYRTSHRRIEIGIVKDDEKGRCRRAPVRPFSVWRQPVASGACRPASSR